MSVFFDRHLGSLRLLDAVALQQGVDGGVFAAESAVELGGMGGATLLKHILAERACGLGIEDTILLEVGEGIGVEHLGPFVGVVACGIAAGEDMAEGGAGHGAFHRLKNLHGAHGLCLEGHGVGDGVGGGVPCHIEIPESELAHA